MSENNENNTMAPMTLDSFMGQVSVNVRLFEFYRDADKGINTIFSHVKDVVDHFIDKDGFVVTESSSKNLMSIVNQFELPSRDRMQITKIVNQLKDIPVALTDDEDYI